MSGEIQKEIEFSFVLDGGGKKLSPTRVENAWRLIRIKKAKLLSRFPMVIQLYKVVEEDLDKSEMVIGIDDGSKFVGFAIVQKCKVRNKLIFKGVLKHRTDVSDKMTERAGYRKYRRKHKRYRPARFNNRGNSKRSGRIPPSIRQRKDAILRVLNKFLGWIKIDLIRLEDVLIDIRKLLDENIAGKGYQVSSRLHENLRLATLMRDNFKCHLCGATGVRFEVHHIVPRRYKGSDTITNLITLCEFCHESIGERELDYKDVFYKYTQGKSLNLGDVQYVMQGKAYLQRELQKMAPLELTFGYETAGVRKILGIPKSHSNDAVVIAGLGNPKVNLVEFYIKPLRKKVANKVEEVKGFRHRDYVSYTKRDGQKYYGYISSLFPKSNQCSIILLNGEVLKRYGLKFVKLLSRFNGIQIMRKGEVI